MNPVEAAWWHKEPDGAVRCELCPIGCRLVEGREGPCGTRVNVGGRMFAREYGRLVSAALDPIEKKPLYHFHPGAAILSIAAQGCNLHCQFCQNWSISQEKSDFAQDATPEQLVAEAKTRRSVGIAYTYSEPLVWYEFVRDTARLARVAGLKNVIVTNGFLNEAPLRELLPWIDAANVDLKSMDDGFYRKVCKARVEPVLRSLRTCRELGVHLEVTNLVIPGWNDSDAQLGALIDFVASLGRDVPLHFSAYRPAWKFDAPPTPASTLARAARLARGKLDFVYAGNIHVDGATDTVCPSCGEVVIERDGYRIRSRLGPGSAACPGCGRRLPIVV
jgi:pyruvate formate lyase activating enzyme